jgi:formate-dependent nitrite reductase membrane component NrfD
MQQEALATLFGGDNTIAFWLWFVALGLVIPLMLEAWELRGGRVRWALLAPVLVLAGGYILRRVALDIGLEVNWTHFATQFDPALLQRLHP